MQYGDLTSPYILATQFFKNGTSGHQTFDPTQSLYPILKKFPRLRQAGSPGGLPIPSAQLVERSPSSFALLFRACIVVAEGAYDPFDFKHRSSIFICTGFVGRGVDVVCLKEG